MAPYQLESMKQQSNQDTTHAAEWADVGSLVPWKENPRKNDGEPVRRVMESIKKFGFSAPIVARRANREVIAGHTRLKAAQALGIDSVPVRFLDISERDAHLLAVADNKLGEYSEWDESVFKVLSEYSLAEAEIAGFTSSDFEAALAGEADEPDAEAVPTKGEARTKLGDIYELGQHVLVCGDSTKPECFHAALGETKVSLYFTDPPYGVSYVGGTADKLTIENDGIGEFGAILDGAFANMLKHALPGSPWYVCSPSGPEHIDFASRLRALGVLRQGLVWLKSAFVMGRSDYHYRHENIYYGWTPGAAHYFVDDRKQDSVWEFAKPSANKIHPTMKPVDLVERAIGNSSLPGDIVMDPFTGSGTTLMACEHMGRRFRGIELSPHYCDAIVARYEAETQTKASLVGSWVATQS